MKLKIFKQMIEEDFKARFQKKINKKSFFIYFFLDLNFRAVVLMRFQHYFYKKGNIVGKLLAIALRNHSIKNYGIEIGNNAHIEGGINFHHVNGIVIGEHVLIGKNFNVYQNVTLGSLKGGYPTIGDNVTIYPGAMVIGKISIGSYSKIGPKVVVRRNIENNTTLYVDNNIYKES